VTSSNLQRAVATVTIALWDRLKETREDVVVQSDLQGDDHAGRLVSIEDNIA
jgi:hypothetical protein